MIASDIIAILNQEIDLLEKEREELEIAKSKERDDRESAIMDLYECIGKINGLQRAIEIIEYDKSLNS